MNSTTVRASGVLLWLGLLMAPVFSIWAYANAWEARPIQLAVLSGWMILFGWAFLPRKLFVVLSLPVVLAGLVLVGADLLAGADLIELIAVWHTFRPGEVVSAVRPYAAAISLAAIAVVALAVWLWRQPRATSSLASPARVALAVSGLAFSVALPPTSWRGAWPVVLAGAAVEGSLGDAGIALPDRPDVRISPRSRFDDWQARRAAAPETPETYVFVIGESIRADRLPACGGRPQIAPAPAGSIVYCDVVSGSSSTHTSVPLLLSRDLPGHHERVPRDATFLKAFEAAGFETFWFGVQERSIAWPDAQNQFYDSVPGLDRDALLPLLDQALAKPSRRKLIVLHAYNAHAPYRERYRRELAPFPVDPARVSGGVPGREAMDQWWNDYDNAVDESMRLLQEIARRLEARPGEALIVFTPDHAENMLDDERGLRLHALRMPTFWDTAVPGVIWANPAWRAAYPGGWKMLQANRASPLMHMDFAPTLLGAARIGYREGRSQPVDLTARLVHPRVRFAQSRAGETVTVDMLRAQAGCQRPAVPGKPGC